MDIAKKFQGKFTVPSLREQGPPCCSGLFECNVVCKVASASCREHKVLFGNAGEASG